MGVRGTFCKTFCGARTIKPEPQPLPTVGESRSIGMKTLTVHCDGGDCGHTRRFTFEELRLDDTWPFIHIRRYRRFVCTRCGSKRFEIAPDWGDVKAHGAGMKI